MFLDDALAASRERLVTHSFDGISIENRSAIPAKGPENGGVWHRIDNVACIYADLRNSSSLNFAERPRISATAYTYFIQSLTVVASRMGAGFVQIHGDAVFALFDGVDAIYKALGTAVTWRTALVREVGPKFTKDTKAEGWSMHAGVGMDIGTVLVRRLGAADREDKNEVWAGSVVNSAAKLSGRMTHEAIYSTQAAYDALESGGHLRIRVARYTCGCSGADKADGPGLDGEGVPLWVPEPRIAEVVDGEQVWRLGSLWCATHGREFCEVIMTGKRPS